MPTRIRLQRHGRKARPFFHIVVADGRAKRDGRFIEKLGTYDPNTNPATIDIDFDRCVHWVGTGAQPSDTARAILSYKGVLMYDHLMRGVGKGALTEDQAKAKFEKWMEDKTAKIDSKKDGLTKEREAAERQRLDREREVKEARIKTAEPEAPAEEEAVAESAEPAEAPAEENKAETSEAAEQAEAAPEETETSEATEEEKKDA